MNKTQDVALNMGQGICLCIRICQESKMERDSKKKKLGVNTTNF